MKTSLFVGNTVAELTNARSWLGEDLRNITVFGNNSNWDALKSSLNYVYNVFKGQNVDHIWSVPLIVQGATLSNAVAGDYDAQYLAIAKQFAANLTTDDQIYIRLGWEFNASWFPWSAIGQPETYAAAFRHVVDVFRSVSDKFVFEWNPNAGNFGVNPELAYPGDKYVDVIGMDFYYNTQYQGTDPVAAFQKFVTMSYGLQWQQDFAALHQKPTAISEWGVNTPNAAPFVELAAKWFEDHGMLFQNYWNSNSAYTGMLSGGQYPGVGDMFKSLFTGPDNDTAIVVPKAIAGTPGTVIGTDGADRLDGGTASDHMYGGRGDDTYVVDSANDTITEYFNSGTDTVEASVSYTLPSLVEVLRLTGTGSLNGTGNSIDNVLYGNGGNNVLRGEGGNDVLDGGGGRDLLYGGTGDDTYRNVDAGDTIVEYAGEGTDTVESTIDYTLGANLENLTLIGKALSGHGNALDNVITGNALNNNLAGGSGNDKLYGMAGNDRLAGGDGNDILDGGTGIDRLDGGNGDDTYYVDNAADQVIEWYNFGLGGTDTVISTVSYALPINVEKLVLAMGAGDINGTGSAGDNTITGNEGNNVINGGQGADTMLGGLGDDTYYVDNAGDVVTEWANAGNDSVISSISYTLTNNLENLTLTGIANINATGNGLNNHIVGNAGNNVLDGGYGADILEGGAGNDTYILDATADVVIEQANAGIDTVMTGHAYTLGANVENLVLTGTYSVNGTGNALDNVITGNSGVNWLQGGDGNDTLYGMDGNDTLTAGNGNDILDGGTGADKMDGGAGDDTYYVDNIGDVIVEWSNAGYDRVYSSIDLTLGNNFEALTLTGNAVRATGNGLDNVIVGNALANVIDGSWGADTLTGGGGADRFVFGASSGRDTITDFGVGGADSLDLSYWLAAGRMPVVSYDGRDTLIQLDGSNSIKLLGVDPSHLQGDVTGYHFG
ncbi:glycosyl hydrolase [Sphingomonas immobilis]|uniref:Glycosyl hydrolase n=1 Tax=Sphingomonas immobilis TaxID=3063997 RepID=A0ABT9A491_9SPHN|nr:glycosyl hydrolase [Sphingomonas sp. CA1-15]MDO7844630.1 glycosyl hydrolase [Sphingomonas sp. CA1-15]